jgi:hypothetical protein
MRLSHNYTFILPLCGYDITKVAGEAGGDGLATVRVNTQMQQRHSASAAIRRATNPPFTFHEAPNRDHCEDRVVFHGRKTNVESASVAFASDTGAGRPSSGNTWLMASDITDALLGAASSGVSAASVDENCLMRQNMAGPEELVHLMANEAEKLTCRAAQRRTTIHGTSLMTSLDVTVALYEMQSAVVDVERPSCSSAPITFRSAASHLTAKTQQVRKSRMNSTPDALARNRARTHRPQQIAACTCICAGTSLPNLRPERLSPTGRHQRR